MLRLFDDRDPRDGPGQMALDEALLETVEEPVLRVYHWTGPWVSFGYSQSFQNVKGECSEAALVRRWTGGGIVDHTDDLTFSLIVPRTDAFARLRPSDSYRVLHLAVKESFADIGVSAILASASIPEAPHACFAGRPAHFDVLRTDGVKICGGAQRRTRQGILHQGSVQHDAPRHDLLSHLVSRLARSVESFTASDALCARSAQLVAGKYETHSWLARVA